MIRYLALLSLCLLAWSVTGRPARAWNDLGHMTVSRIAWLRLTERERAAVVSALRHHPHLREVLLKDCPPHTDQDEWLFVNAATWPDRVRPPRVAGREPVKSHPIYRFHHGAWHYANWEFRPGRTSTSADARHLKSGHAVEPGEIVEQLDHSLLILSGAERERSEPEAELDDSEIRAIRLCWLMHLMGDIHQPLHVINYIDDQIPSLQTGDDGGNKLAIRTNHTSGPRKLHAYWDDILGTHPQWNKVEQAAEMLTHDPSLSAARLPQFERHKLTHEFAEESYQIARSVIYQNGQLHFALWSRVESHELAATDVPVLTQQSVDQAQRVAHQQILLAGERLAQRLKAYVSRTVTPREQEELASPSPRDPRRRFVR